MSHYNHLTIEERESLLIMQVEGHTIRRIATTLHRSPSTISRELKRNKIFRRKYSPTKATEYYHKRRKQCRRKKLLEDEDTKKKVQYLFLHQQWSPEQISNRLRYENNPISISYATIYRGIYTGLLEVKQKLSHGERGVVKKLRHRGKARHRKGDVETRGKIVISNPIKMRPKEANLREEIGHWEADTVVGKKNTGCLVTLADRYSRYFIARRVTAKASLPVADTMVKIFKQLPTGSRKSITPDRGKEFAKHALVTEQTGIEFYFPDPHAPWQRPTNENFNGLLREYMPKSSDFSAYSNEDIRQFVKKLNTRPRKCLGWKTPKEVFYSVVLHLT